MRYYNPFCCCKTPKSMISITLQVEMQTVGQRTGGSDATRPSQVLPVRKILQCSYCSYTTTHSSHLRTHQYRHTGEKPFSCSYCSYSSNQKTNLRTHIRRHTGEKPYTCTYCSYCAAQKANLNFHMLKHKANTFTK